MRGPDFGAEWNIVLVLEAVLAVLVLLAIFQWWLGVLGLAGALIGLGVAVWWNE